MPFNPTNTRLQRPIPANPALQAQQRAQQQSPQGPFVPPNLGAADILEPVAGPLNSANKESQGLVYQLAKYQPAVNMLNFMQTVLSEQEYVAAKKLQHEIYAGLTTAMASQIMGPGPTQSQVNIPQPQLPRQR